ncbi:hypothetical protein [Sphingobacterium detergens]|uniref:Parallel beta helix pectate lyase-like protein n=1 Tax=Sphingobacterium detergens TaxID=1145106 RepID=A0A420B7P1_SPHD1|nr:hypothetical protein [Sphingobacterium detergens]RKE52727.1 hypothetical protein DFQ12_2971 [Sphingobacterium detergens]
MANQFLIKNTMADMRDLCACEITDLQKGIYCGVQLLGYYQAGDTPAPIEYFLSTTNGSDNGGSIIATGGITLEHRFLEAVNPLYFGAKAGLDTDATPSIQQIFNSGYRSVEISCQLLADSYLGLPDATVQRYPSHRIIGKGGSVHLTNNVNDGWITSQSSLLNPGSTDNLYTGKVFIDNLVVRNAGADMGNVADNTPLSGTFIDGDRIYNVFITKCSFFRVKHVIKSYKEKRPDNTDAYPNGYLQSVTIIGNIFEQVERIIDAYRCFNFTFKDNMCEGCLSGIWFKNIEGKPTVNVARIVDNIFEGGGVFLYSGPIAGGKISGNYFEGNYNAEIKAYKAHLYFKFETGTNYMGLAIDSNNFQSHVDQKVDVGFSDIKFDGNFTTDAEYLGNVSIRNNNSNSYSLVEPQSRIKFYEGNSITADMYSRSRTVVSPTQSRVSFQRKRQELLSSTSLSSDGHVIARINIARIKSLMTRQEDRTSNGTINIMLLAKTSGMITIGSTLAIVDFLIMPASEGMSSGAIDEVYYKFKLRSVLNIDAGKPINSNFSGATTKAHFNEDTAVLTAVPDGDFVKLILSTFVAPSIDNFGKADRLLSFQTIQINASNNSYNVGYTVL